MHSASGLKSISLISLCKVFPCGYHMMLTLCLDTAPYAQAESRALLNWLLIILKLKDSSESKERTGEGRNSVDFKKKCIEFLQQSLVIIWKKNVVAITVFLFFLTGSTERVSPKSLISSVQVCSIHWLCLPSPFCLLLVSYCNVLVQLALPDV